MAETEAVMPILLLATAFGQQLLSGQFTDAQSLHTIDIRKLNPDVYFISVSVDNKSETFKFLKK